MYGQNNKSCKVWTKDESRDEWARIGNDIIRCICGRVSQTGGNEAKRKREEKTVCECEKKSDMEWREKNSSLPELKNVTLYVCVCVRVKSLEWERATFSLLTGSQLMRSPSRCKANDDLRVCSSTMLFSSWIDTFTLADKCAYVCT